MDLKYFTKEGNVYKKKAQFSYAIILTLAFLLFAYGGYHIKLPTLMWICLGLAAFVPFSIMSQYLEIDTSQKVIKGKTALLRPSFCIAFDNIQNFELYSLSHNFIRTNTALHVYYINEKGKEKMTALAQGFTMKAMQNTLNEIEDILAHEQPGR